MSIFSKEEKEPKKGRIYTPEELIEFDKELEPYKIDGEIDGRKVKYLSVGGEFAYLQDRGIIKSYGKITSQMKNMTLLPEWKIKNEEKFIEYELDCFVGSVLVSQSKMKQYFNWKGKKDIAFRLSIEEYEKVAKSFLPVLEEEIIPEEIPF